jgi:hypothetical protein
LWYWLADLFAKENIRFILGYALYMRAAALLSLHNPIPCRLQRRLHTIALKLFDYFLN